MKTVAILALCFVSVIAAPNYGGSSVVRSSGYSSSAPLLKSSLESAPVIRASSYSAPLLKSSYESAPVIRTNSYESAPVIRTSSSSYESAPVVRTNSYESAPVIRSEGYTSHHVPILKYVKTDDNYGTYNMDIQTGDGISQVESGNLRNLGDPEGPVVVKDGSYSFTSPEGQHFTVHYTADENGFRASGAHLPTPPPIPAEILPSLRGSSGYSHGLSSGSIVRSAPYGGSAIRTVSHGSSYGSSAPLIRSTY